MYSGPVTSGAITVMEDTVNTVHDPNPVQKAETYHILSRLTGRVCWTSLCNWLANSDQIVDITCTNYWL